MIPPTDLAARERGPPGDAGRVRLGIVGGGVAGAACALAVQRPGVACVVFESRPARDTLGLGMILKSNGLKALDALGLGAEVRARGVGARRVERRAVSGELILGKQVDQHVCVFRHDLLDVLHGALPDGVVRRGWTCLGAHQGPAHVHLRFEDRRDVSVHGLIVADGRGSRLRPLVGCESEPGTTGIKELINVVRAPHLVGDLAGRLVKYVDRAGGLAVGLAPAARDHLFWYVQFDAERYAPPRGPAQRRHFARRLFRTWPDPLPELVETTDYADSYLADVAVMEPPERLHRRKIVLVGDAAHPLPTLLGEGGNTALADAASLGECMRGVRSPDDLPSAFDAFDRCRLPRFRRLHRQGLAAVRDFLHPAPSETAAHD